MYRSTARVPKSRRSDRNYEYSKLFLWSGTKTANPNTPTGIVGDIPEHKRMAEALRQLLGKLLRRADKLLTVKPPLQ
jgi:hypothetical protein